MFIFIAVQYSNKIRLREILHKIDKTRLLAGQLYRLDECKVSELSDKNLITERPQTELSHIENLTTFHEYFVFGLQNVTNDELNKWQSESQGTFYLIPEKHYTYFAKYIQKCEDKYKDRDSSFHKSFKQSFSDYQPPDQSLIIIKPDIFSRCTSEPHLINSVLDHFLNNPQLELKLKKIAVLSLSIATATKFYEPVIKQLIEKFPNGDGEERGRQIIQFMTGLDPKNEQDKMKKEGTEKVMALIVEGASGSIQTIRKNILGSTNPKEAQKGTIRAEFGTDIMKNAAHASDSKERAKEEIKILGLDSNFDQYWRVQN